MLVMLNIVFSDLRDTPEAEHVPGTGEETRVILNTTWSWSQTRAIYVVMLNTTWSWSQTGVIKVPQIHFMWQNSLLEIY